MEDLDADRDQPRGGRWRFACSGVAGETWVGTAGDLQPELVPGTEPVGG